MNHGLGDVIMTLPLVGAIVSPKNELTIMVKSAIEKSFLEYYFSSSLDVLDIIVLPKSKIKRMALLAWFALSNKKFDYAIIGFNINYTLATLFLKFLKARVKVGKESNKLKGVYDIRLPEEGMHKVEYSKLQAEVCGLSPFDMRLERGKEKVNQICFALASGGQPPSKDMAVDRAIEIAKSIAKKHHQNTIVILGGNDNLEFNKQLANNLLEYDVINLSGKTSFKDLVEVLSVSKKLYTTCNGVSHIASLVDIDIVSFNGPTDSMYTGPYSDKLITISRGLSCSPCYRPGYTRGCGNPICMNFKTTEILKKI